jgi:AcrR family transcriptional regulator
VREGFEKVTLRRIAEAIEYTPAALYVHFEDKHALMSALCDDDFGLLREAMRTADAIEDPVERVRATGQAYVDFALAHPHHYRFMFMTPWPPPADAELISKGEQKAIKQGNPDEDAYAFLRHGVAACIADGRFREPFTDVDIVTQICWASAHGVVSLFVTHGQDPWVGFRQPNRTAYLMLDAVLDGMVASPRAVRAGEPVRIQSMTSEDRP